MSCLIGYQDPLLAHHMPKVEALDIAISLTRDDEDGWQYTVLSTERPGQSIIGITDLDGEVLGYL